MNTRKIAVMVSEASHMATDFEEAREKAISRSKANPDVVFFYGARRGMSSTIGIVYTSEAGATDECHAVANSDGYRMILCVDYLINQLQAGGCKIDNQTITMVL